MHNREFEISFHTGTVSSVHLHHEVEFLYVMEGELQLQLLDHTYTMKEEDFVVINSSHRHSWTSSMPAAVCGIRFDQAMMLEQMDKRLIFFHCNSAREEDGRYEYIRNLMGRLLSEYAVNADKTTFRRKSLIYDLLDYLTRYFMLDETRGILDRDDLRVEKMLQYVNANYQRPLSLQEMAEFMYMAPSSFSRFFKRATGVNFLEYINQLRLHYALEDLCYTNNSITWISETHGFTNVSAFCRVFKEEYGETPMAYRKKFENREISDETKEKDIRNYLKKYMEKDPMKLSSNYKTDMLRIECNTQQFAAWNNPWNRAMNLGFAHELLNSIVRNQIMEAKREIGFSAGRICGVFSEKMMLRRGHDYHITNYIYMDMVLDLLVENGIRPILSLDNKQESILKGVSDIIYESPEEETFENMEELLSVLEDFLQHIVMRYGLNEVSGWIFECWYESYKGTVLGLKTGYVPAFKIISRKIKSIIPGAEVGGWGISSTEGEDGVIFSKIMEEWGKSECRPDFVSVNLFPYMDSREENDKRDSKRLLNNAEFYKRAIQSCRNKMDECGMNSVPIYVAEWNTSMSKRNYYNETCGKAALILQMIAELNVRVEYAAYKELSDLSGIYHDSSTYLFGGMGLFNIYGARKPVFYALKFLRQMKPYLVHKDSHSVITLDGFGTYTILCFNAKQLKYNYYRKEEGDLQADEIEEIFEDKKNLEITFCLNHVENGTYNIKEYSIRPHRGSVLHEWMCLGAGEKLDQEDYEYLREISRPVRRRAHVNVTQGKMVLLQTLAGNEVRLLKISR